MPFYEKLTISTQATIDENGQNKLAYFRDDDAIHDGQNSGNTIINFTDSDADEITSFSSFLSKIISGISLKKFVADFKEGMNYVLSDSDVVTDLTALDTDKPASARTGSLLSESISTILAFLKDMTSPSEEYLPKGYYFSAITNGYLQLYQTITEIEQGDDFEVSVNCTPVGDRLNNFDYIITNILRSIIKYENVDINQSSTLEFSKGDIFCNSEYLYNGYTLYQALTDIHSGDEFEFNVNFGYAENILNQKLNIDGDTVQNILTGVSSDVADEYATSWTSVTPLASGETHTSIFSKISQMFKNIRFLYNILGTTDISSIGNGTVTGIISNLNTNKINYTDVVDSLTSTSASLPLSANMGKELNDAKIDFSDVVDSLSSTSSVAPLSANMGNQLSTTKVNVSDIVNDLTHTDTNKPLSAAQGKALNDTKINISDIVDTLTSTSDDEPLSANMGKTLNDTKINISDIVNDLTHTDTDKPLSANMGNDLSTQIDNLLGVHVFTVSGVVQDVLQEIDVSINNYTPIGFKIQQANALSLAAIGKNEKLYFKYSSNLGSSDIEITVFYANTQKLKTIGS